jgi:dienelactone hydrolase
MTCWYRLVAVTGFLSLALACLPAAGAEAPAADLRVLPEKLDGAAPREMLRACLLRRAQTALDRRLADYEKLKTPEQVAAHQDRLRQFFIAQLGTLPERTPLAPQVVARQQRDGYRVEKVIFQSQPRHYVTALLYLPEGKPPFPGVLVPCGHSSNGKARDLYQRMPILLARNGIVALCYDPIDQGERGQLLDAQGKALVGSTVGHTLTGVGAILLGRNAATYRIWDGMRAIDYLAGRPEVDPKRIGCTGISGGGTLTSYLMALDERILAAAPGCYLTSLRRLLETIGPQDAEQNIHAQIARGMDHADYVLMRAPRPTLIMTATRDYFDIGGAWDSFRQAKRWYARYNLPERVDFLEVDDVHGFPKPMREAAARWMRRWLAGSDDAVTEPECAVATDDEVRCTPRGQVMLIEGARSVYDLNADLEGQLAHARRELWQKAPKEKALEEVRRITGIRRLAALPDATCEKVGTLARPGCRIDKLIVRTEPGIWLPALAFVPEKRSGEAYLYLDAAGKQAGAAPGGPIEKLAAAGHLVLAVDLCGLGETAKADKGAFVEYFGPQWRECFMAYMLDTSLLAMRAEQILVAARVAGRYESGGKPGRVHLVSVGRTGPPALHAAALEPGLFASLTLRSCLVSWSQVVRTPLARNQLENVVHGALRAYDLPDLLASLPAAKVKIADPLDAAERPADSPVDGPRAAPAR